MRDKARRLLFVMQSEGIKSCIGRIKNAILSHFGLRVSETYFYRLSINKHSDFKMPTIHPSLRAVLFKVLDSSTDMKRCRSLPKKLEFIPVERWFSRRSLWFALESKARIIAYTWVHFKYYDNLGLAGTLVLDENEVFIGPFYVDPAHRGRKLYYLMMSESLRYLKNERIITVYTASNSQNIATIKVAVRSGFDVVGCIRAKKSHGWTVLEFNRQGLLSAKLKPKI